MAVFQKYASERFQVGIDFTDTLAEGEYITIDSQCSVVALEDGSNRDVSADMLVNTIQADVNNKIALIKIQGGSPGHQYILKFVVHTSVDNIFERDVVVSVE